MIQINNVYSAGQPGQFRGNGDVFGWKSHAEGGQQLIHNASDVKRAEWLEGKLKVLCESEGAESVLSLDGFRLSDFDNIWRYFEQNCGIYVKKHRPAAEVSEASFDNAMQSLEMSADQVDDAPSGSVQKKAKEQDLLKKVEGVRDGLEEAVKGDKQALSRVFAANGCERIGRLRLVLDTVQLEVYRTDERWKHLRNMARTVESVLREVGSFRLWKPSETDKTMARRQMVWELRKRQGDDVDGMLTEEWETDEAVVENPEPSGIAVSKLKEGLEGLPFGLPILRDPLDLNGRARGGYAAGEVVQPQTTGPQPDPVPTIDDRDHESDGDDIRTGFNGGNNGDLHQYEDQEVENPIATPAAPPGYENAMGLGQSDAQRRMYYTRTDSVLEGWVWKRSRFLKKWRRRWLVLTPSALESLKQRGAPRATESIEAGSVHRVYSAEGEVQMARCYCVVGNKRSFYMVCDDEAQKTEWITQITSVLGQRR